MRSVWNVAYSIHAWGFHDAKLDVDDVKMDLPNIEWLLEYTKQIIKKR